MSKIRLHGSSSGYTEIAPVAASGNNTLTLSNDGTIISQDSNGAVGVTSITVGTGVTIGDGRVTCTTVHGSAASLTQIPAANIVGVCTSGLTKTGGFGKFLQVVQNSSHTRRQTTSTTFVASTHTVTITPVAASSKILVNFIASVNTDGSNHRIFLDVYRSVAGGTATGLAPQGSNTTTGASDSAGFFGSVRADNSRLQAPMNLQYLDSPTYSLGNSIVYTLYARSGTGGNVEVPGANEQEPVISMVTEIAS